jgi:hypothetical protein
MLFLRQAQESGRWFGAVFERDKIRKPAKRLILGAVAMGRIALD